MVKNNHICGSRESETDEMEHFGNFFYLKTLLNKTTKYMTLCMARFFQHIVVMYNPRR